MQVHLDRVESLPPPLDGDEWVNLGYSEACPIQGMALQYPSEAPPLPSAVKGSAYVAFDVDDATTGSAGPLPIRRVHVLTLQGHPDYNTRVTRDLLRALRDGQVIDQKAYEDAALTVARSHDGHAIAKMLLAMLGVEPATGELDALA